MMFPHEWDEANRRYKREEASKQYKYTHKIFDDINFEEFFKQYWDNTSYNRNENVDTTKAEKIAKIRALLNDPAATEGEKQACRNILNRIEVCA